MQCMFCRRRFFDQRAFLLHEAYCEQAIPYERLTDEELDRLFTAGDDAGDGETRRDQPTMRRATRIDLDDLDDDLYG